MLVDIVLIVVSVMIVLRGIKRGFISSVLGLIAWLVAAFCVVKFSMPIAEWIYIEFFRESTIRKVSETLQSDYAFGTAQSQFSAFTETISSLLKASTKLIGTDTSQNVLSFDASGMTLEQVSRTITDSYLAPLVIQICKWFISFIGFFVLVSLFNIVGNFIAKLIKSTPFKNVDKLLGAVAGILKAAVMIFVFSLILQTSSGLIQSNNSIKSMKSDEDKVKVSGFVQSVDDSKIVAAINDKISF